MTQTDLDLSLQAVLAIPEFIELMNSDLYSIDLKYASEDNFMKENLYKGFNRAFLHRHAAHKLENAAIKLKEHKKNYRFIIYDALRPRSVQWKMWNSLMGKAEQKYIANPVNGSNHNFGMAVDLSIIDSEHKILDMGTQFDEFTELSQPKLEAEFIAQKKISTVQAENRQLLRSCMEHAGFRQLSTEWWHFDALPKSEIRSHYRIVE